jgi:hypothetical protein
METTNFMRLVPDIYKLVQYLDLSLQQFKIDQIGRRFFASNIFEFNRQHTTRIQISFPDQNSIFVENNMRVIVHLQLGQIGNQNGAKVKICKCFNY